MTTGHFAPFLSAKCPASGLEKNDGTTAAMNMSAAPLELNPYRSLTSMVIPVSNRPPNVNPEKDNGGSKNHIDILELGLN
jgi:hypothetical protein